MSSSAEKDQLIFEFCKLECCSLKRLVNFTTGPFDEEEEDNGDGDVDVENGPEVIFITKETTDLPSDFSHDATVGQNIESENCNV